MTWPAAANLNGFIPGSEGDALVHLWTFRWVKQTLLAGQSPYYTHLLFYPNGVSLAFHNFAWVHIAAWLPLQALLGEGPAYALVFLLIFPLNGLAVYWLAHDVTGSRLAAFVGGLAAAFWPFILAHHNHPNLIFIAAIPLTLLYLRRLLRNGRFPDALLTGLFLALIGLSRWQLLSIGGFLLGFYLLYRFVVDKSVRQWRLVGYLLLAGLLAGLIMAPLLYPVLNAQLTRAEPESLFVNETVNQTDLLAYVLPSRYHPLWGEAVYDWYQNVGSSVTFTPFLGYTVLALCVLGVWRQRRPAWFWLLAALLYLTLALGAQLHINGAASITLPFAWLDDLFFVRIVRHPDRFNVVLSVPVAILAAFGVKALISRREVGAGSAANAGLTIWRYRTGMTYALVGLVSLFILAEYIVTYPLYPLTSPAWYRQLAEEPGQFGILDMPMGSRSYDKEYMLHQSVHGKPLVGGHTSRPPASAFDFINSVPLLHSLQEKPTTPPDLSNVSHQLQLLRAADVRYLIVHKKFLTEEQAAAWRAWLVLPPLFEDDELLVYKTETAVAGSDFDITPLITAGDKLGLIQSHLAPAAASQGDWLTIDLDWGSATAVARDYDLCLYLSTGGETVFTQCELLTPDWPTANWRANEIVHRQHKLPLDPFWPPGEYILSASLRETGETAVPPTPTPINAFTLNSRPRQFTEPQPSHPTAVTWADKIRLVGYDTAVSNTLDITLYWQAQRRMEQSYKVFIHLINAADNSLAAQADFIPRDWSYPTNWWEQGEFITDTIHLPLAAPLTGEYTLLIGFYDPDTQQRLPAYAANGDPLPDMAAQLPIFAP